MFGPLTLMRRWRTAAFGASIYVFSLFLLYENFSHRWNAFALGLIFPGGGFLYSGGVAGCLLAAIAFLALPIAVVNWFASGNMAIVLFAWLGGAVLAGVFAGTGSWSWVIPAVPTLVAAVVLLWIIGNRMSLREEVARARAHNAAFAGLTPLLRQFPVLAEGPELNPLELAVTCKTFDKALQPLNQWKGITLDVEQWQLSATRYQLYAASWQLAAVQYRHTPAFAGYSRDAQANLLQRMLDRRIWGFWFWENLWGNFDPNPDPIRRDNIMVSGYVAEIVGIFETLTGDRRFDLPGGLTYRWSDKKVFAYDYTGLIDALMYNFQRYDYRWMPCEPNLIYSPCNFKGFTAIKLHDRLRGENRWEQIRERVERSFEDEFTHADGRVVCLTFDRLGLRAPTLSSVLGEAGCIPCMIALWPDKAERLWQVMKRDFIERRPDGSIHIAKKFLSWDTWDTTNYYIRPMVELRPLATLLVAACEMGDSEVVDALSSYLDGKYGAGASAAVKIARRRGLWRDLITQGMPEAWVRGPRLTDVAYPDVLVARAVTDGEALDLVLRPGAGPKRVSLGFERLCPGRRYRVIGAESQVLVADLLGRASVTAQLNDRIEVRVAPDG
jgi:hypothetical protein